MLYDFYSQDQQCYRTPDVQKSTLPKAEVGKFQSHTLWQGGGNIFHFPRGKKWTLTQSRLLQLIQIYIALETYYFCLPCRVRSFERHWICFVSIFCTERWKFKTLPLELCKYFCAHISLLSSSVPMFYSKCQWCVYKCLQDLGSELYPHDVFKATSLWDTFDHTVHLA